MRLAANESWPVTYNPDPVTQVQSKRCCAGAGHLELYQAIGELLQGVEQPLVCLDFYWSPSLEETLRGIREQWGDARWFETRTALKSSSTLETEFAEFLTEDPVFGRVCDRELDVFFEPQAWQELCESVQRAATEGPVVVAGPGAMLAPLRNLCHCAVYLQVPREAVFVPSQNGIGRNLGDDLDRGAWGRYKRSFYLDWPIQNRHRDSVWRACDLVVDASDPAEPRFVETEALERALQQVASQPFRVRSLFMPGVWGGQRLSQLIPGLPQEWPNCAWGFELVGPENSLKLCLDDKLEFRLPFDHLMAAQAKAILGRAGYRRYGTFFPVRFDFLDTIGGSNLSCQVHPPDAYINSRFREPMAQNEMYYIMEAKDGAEVYLGHNSSSTEQAFRADVERAKEQSIPFELSEHVNAWPSRPGDLFVIPAGTVHCSGEGNLVLEISATPYIYTFKIYDYLRPDLNGQPRPISSARAFEVLDFSRNTEWVKQHLIAVPQEIEVKGDWKRFLLSDHPDMPHRVERLEGSGCYRCGTDDGVQILCLVEGERVKVLADGQFELPLSYAETVIIPAACRWYELQSEEKVKVIKCSLR